MQRSLINNKQVYRVLEWILLCLLAFILIKLAPTLIKPEYLPSDDFFHFWAAGNLNLQGKNPFDTQIIDQLRFQQGSIPSSTLSPIMLNPPWAISLLLPFGLIRYPLSRLTWLLFSIILILLSTQLLWQIYSGNLKLRWLPILMVFIFAPTISVLEKGQITPIVMIAITGFLYYSSHRQNDWLAGGFLALASIKPQVALVFWTAVLFWMIFQHRWKILTSFSISILVMILVATVFNQDMLRQYIGMLQTYHLSEWATPTIGSYLRLFWLGIDKFWLQFLPTIIGMVWFIFYWFKHKESWNWLYELPLLLFVSQLTSPYSWSYDLIIFVPAIVLATIWMVADWKHWSILFLFIIYLAINAADLILHMKLDEFWFIWLTPAFLIWFFLVRWISQKNKDRQLITATR